MIKQSINQSMNLLPRDATQSAIMPQLCRPSAVQPSVSNVQVPYIP